MKVRFAKMTAVPDKLTETPERDSGGGIAWTFSTTSWGRCG